MMPDMIQADAASADFERRRLEALRSYCVLDSGREPGFDGLTELAARACATPIALISLVDEKRLYFKSAHGLDAYELPDPGNSFCGYAVRQRDLFVVRDARHDPRFANNPIVSGPPHIVFYAAAPLISPEGFPLGTLCVLDHVPRVLNTERAEMLTLLGRQVITQLELRSQGARDSLTGLYNRRQMLDTLGRELFRAQRAGTCLSLALVDLDHFKRFNDTYGHSAGDRMLEASGRLLVEHTRLDDVACRYGGEELALILPGARLDDAERRVAELIARFRDLRVRTDGRELSGITASAGVAEFPANGATIEALIEAADAALYRAKAGGRDRVEHAGA